MVGVSNLSEGFLCSREITVSMGIILGIDKNIGL